MRGPGWCPGLLLRARESTSSTALPCHGDPSARCNRRISAQSSTDNTPSPPGPIKARRTGRGSKFGRRHGGIFQAASRRPSHRARSDMGGPEWLCRDTTTAHLDSRAHNRFGLLPSDKTPDFALEGCVPCAMSLTRRAACPCGQRAAGYVGQSVRRRPTRSSLSPLAAMAVLAGSKAPGQRANSLLIASIRSCR